MAILIAIKKPASLKLFFVLWSSPVTKPVQIFPEVAFVKVVLGSVNILRSRAFDTTWNCISHCVSCFQLVMVVVMTKQQLHAIRKQTPIRRCAHLVSSGSSRTIPRNEALLCVLEAGNPGRIHFGEEGCSGWDRAERCGAIRAATIPFRRRFLCERRTRKQHGTNQESLKHFFPPRSSVQ